MILWIRGSLTINYSFKGVGYVGININWKGVDYNLVNIYAPCSVVDRRVIWSSLLDRRRKGGGNEWCLVGDFNKVTSIEKKVGDNALFNRRGMEDFRGFIGYMELIDIPSVRGKFTWFKDNGKSMSRLDRFLLSRKMIE